MIEFIVNAGADVNAQDNNCCTHLYAASVDNSIVGQGDKTFEGSRASIREFLRREGGTARD